MRRAASDLLQLITRFWEIERGAKSEKISTLNHFTRISLIVSFVLPAAALVGWTFGIPLLEGLGKADQPIKPIAAVCYLAIAVALGASMVSRVRLATVLLAIPAFFIVTTMFQDATGLALGVDHWLFPNKVAADHAGAPGRPYVATIATMTMLTIAVAIAHRSGRRYSQAVAALASVALGVSLLCASVALFNLIPPHDMTQRFLPSSSAAEQAVAISITLLAWRGRSGWPDLLSADTPHAAAMRRAFPLIILVPTLTAMVNILLANNVPLPPLLLDLLAAAINIAVFAALIFWSMAHISAEHRALLQTTNAMASAPIVLTSLSGEIQQWSRGCEELYGWEADEVVGRRKYDVLCSRDAATSLPLRRRDDVRGADRALIEQQRDGTTVNVIERVRLVEVEGSPPILAHSMIDVTARVEVEAALRESEANLTLALEAYHIGTFDWNSTSRRIVWSPGTEQRLGLQPGDMATFAQWMALVDRDDMAAIYATIQDARSRHTESYRFRYRLKVPDGGVRMIEGSGRFSYGADGALARVTGLNVDVTDRHERESALLAEQELFRSVLKTAPTAMIIFDDDSTIKAFSASAERMLGYTADEVIGRNIEILIPEPVRHKKDALIARYLADRESHITDGSNILYAQRRDGGLLPIDLWMGDSRVGRNRLFTVFCEDITERLATEERLTDMRTELVHVSRVSAMGEMAAGLAHELNQPLAAAVYFLGAADLLLSDEANRERGQALVRLANEQNLRAGEIIRRMRKFMTKEDHEAQNEPIAAIIEDAVAMMFVGGKQFDIDLRYDLDPTATFVMADRVQIQQVLINLLRNATDELRKCPPAGRAITVATKALDNDTVAVSVTDTGPGLDPLIIDRIHMPFVSTKGDKGMGIGLSICRRIVEAHGGTFGAANNPGGGAVFRFTLPGINA